MSKSNFKNKKKMEYTLEELIISLHEQTESINKSKKVNKNELKESIIFALDIIYTYDIGDEEFFVLIEKLNSYDKSEADHFLKLYEKIKKEKKGY